MSDEKVKATRAKSAVKRRAKPANVAPNQHWLDRYWRTAMAYTYLMICMYDFVLGPIVFNILEYLNPDNAITHYESVTLQSGGFIHMTFGAILGIASHGRNKVQLQNSQ